MSDPARYDGSRPEPPYPTQADTDAVRAALERILSADDEEDGAEMIHALRDARVLLQWEKRTP